MTTKTTIYGKWLLAGVLTALPFTIAANVYAAPPQAVSKEAPTKEYELFLKEKLGITLPPAPKKGDFLSALADALKLEPTADSVIFKDLALSSPYYADAKALYQQGFITADSVHAADRLSALNAVQIAVKAAGLQELADTYPKAKVEKAFAKLKLNTADFAARSAQVVAAAVDTGLLPEAFYPELKPKAAASEPLSATLIGKVLTVRGQYKHYIGYVGDPDIFGKLSDAYRSSDIIQSDELQKIVDTALEQNIVTGYNLKDARYDANFVNSLSLTYGHSDLKHALQLIGLLRSEGIDAKVQFEPKTSAFVYLKEWGDPGESDLYEVKQIANGNYIEYAKEYDIAFEFDTAADKERFDQIVLAYAKKNADEQAGLIAGSWWQPLYYSLTELKGYKKITNNKITAGHYYAQSFSLKEQSASVTAGFKKADPSVKVENYDFWTDVPFFNYLNGESK
ncbi:hypothetical protein ACFPVX_07390 [Cohnella faecalis]|uniref:SLH domain-containing protein n=1 Tax=Cohnella faecalis TaxID=2315694 RepID=A0A398CDJ5_9BACL|nr:hypothetical protein [Cohnella faecalis]RIE00773.1 hypothetical protein D3H35_26640 [Cohnella faecalis]